MNANLQLLQFADDLGQKDLMNNLIRKQGATTPKEKTAKTLLQHRKKRKTKNKIVKASRKGNRR